MSDVVVWERVMKAGRLEHERKGGLQYIVGTVGQEKLAVTYI